MFVESIEGLYKFRTLVNLNTGTGLKLCRIGQDSLGYDVWQVSVIGTSGSVILKNTTKEAAEKLYNHLKDEWVGKNIVTEV